MRKLKVSELGGKPLYLVEHPVPSGVVEKPSTDNLNHIWIFDRSGSMGNVLNGLVDDLIQKSKQLQIGDILSVGWFSGEGQYRFVLKGFKIADDSDYKLLEDTFKKLRTTVGMTCFSEILYDTKSVVEELAVFDAEFSLMFLTDGYPVVNNYKKEMTNIFDAISQIQGKISSSVLVGYGNYYNKELMSQMAEAFGGSLIHSDEILTFSEDFTTYIESARTVGSKVILELNGPILYPFSISEKNVNIYSVVDGKISFSKSKKKEDLLYYFTVDADGIEEIKSVEETDIKLVRALYASAFVLSSKTKTDLALEVLAKLGDVALIDGVVNAFTNEEYGRVENNIRKALNSKKARFLKGRNTNYLPDENATCIVDIADILMKTEDDEEQTLFYPYHPDFRYERIGLKQFQVDKSIKFESFEKNPGVKIDDLAWHDTMLNLSFKIRIPGKINLPEKASEFGLANEYKTFKWRNYTLVKDGFLNMKTIFIKPSPSVSKALVEIAQKEDKKFLEDVGGGIYKFDLSVFPVMNRGMAKNSNSATALCKACDQELDLEAKLKVLKNYKSDLEERVTKESLLSKEAEEFLKEIGIADDGSFKPATETDPPLDYYDAKEFAVAIKNFSNLPSLNAVRKKLETIKNDTKGKAKFTDSEGLLYKHMSAINEAFKKIEGDSVKLAYVKQQIVDAKKELKSVRTKIQRTKFAILLGKKSFVEFESREENSLVVDGKTFTISVKETRIPV